MAFPKSAFGKLSLILGVLFFVSAGLQYNDPDPLAWFLLYAAAGVVSALGAFALGGQKPRSRQVGIAAAVCGLIALGWAALLAPSAIPHLTVVNLLESMKAETPAIEESRELFGLLLIALWMVALFFRLRTERRRSTT